ncbi:hypothetical protein PXNS11_180041 [Stutzerimonas xanthomarina]|nr:hypothetical protein PXNS11_180041 [Stutzerimonas xanthomarina]
MTDGSTVIEIAQVPLCDFAYVRDQARHLGISRHDEVQYHGMGAGVLRKVCEAAALPLIVDVRFCTFHELLLFHVLLLRPSNTRMDQ